MSIRVLLRDFPTRSIALVTSTHALIFRHSSNDPLATNGSFTSLQITGSRNSIDGAGTARCMVEFADLSTTDISDYRTLSPLPVYGTLGLITINGDVFLCVVVSSVKVASVRPNEMVEKITVVQFYCLNSSNYDYILSDGINPYSTEALIQDNYSYGQNLSRREPEEHPCLEVQKLLSDGSFYYSTDFDLTNRLQDRAVETSTFDSGNLDESFLWNSYMISPLVKFRSHLVGQEKKALDASGILTSAIRGFVSTITIPHSSAPARAMGPGLPSTLTLISRLSCKRAGTRFNSRGIDDDGNVANFVETETVYWSPSGLCFSYAQIRGSVPVFWEQLPGLIPGQQKITITRSMEATQPAFNRHFEDLERKYSAVHVINLLSENKEGEAELSANLRNGVRHCSLNYMAGAKKSEDHELLRVTEYDFHAETKGPNGYEAASMIRNYIEASAEGFAYYLSEELEDPVTPDRPVPHRRAVVVLQQEGVFRTNCLDCLDRTNLIQTIISQMALEAFLGHRGERASSDFWMRHSTLWADNGDALSTSYAGTGALKSTFTRTGKYSFAGALADAKKSMSRMYINNFVDKGRQKTIDVLLGRLIGQFPVHLYDPINDFVMAELNRRSAEYSSSKVIRIWAGTFNLNGRTEGLGDDLSEWLCPQLDRSQQQPEIVAVGFQEIVELSPQQIMNSDPTRKQAWENAVRATLNRHAHAAGSEEYVLLRSGQLVGAALCIFVRASVLNSIKNVEGSVKKTGLSGMAGNKGAVAIRLDFAKTQICFVTAHLAAGFANYEERNRDYLTIQSGLKFQKGKGIDNHDTVIWMGDFNYRIGLPSEKVRALIKAGDLETLYENDQLNLQMVAGLSFQYYSEARITFMPTYKFDLGTDVYDSSEKARIPAWTDRILRKGSNLRQIVYDRAELRFSDHRPVYATFQCTVSIVDEQVRESLSRSIYEKRRADVENSTAKTPLDDTDDDDLTGYEPIEPSLPPASSDRRKWWLDNGKPARSTIEAPAGASLNPRRPSNPFKLTDEADWVSVSRVVTSTPADPAPRVKQTNSSNGTPQKLLPAPDGSLADSRRRAEEDTNEPRDRGVLSSPSHGPRKPAPPVARKPLHLTSSPSLNGSASSPDTPKRNGVENPLPPRRNTNGNGINNGIALGVSLSPDPKTNVHQTPPPPPQARRSGSRVLDTITHDEVPWLPPKPNQSSVDLLGDGSEEGSLREWEVLKPS